jgi:hypothetical protein
VFEVGDLVVCVDDKPTKGPIAAIVPIHSLIRVGRVYRINYVGLTSLGKVTLGLEGVILPHPMKGFAPYRFRKISPADDEFSLSLERAVGDASRESELI